MGRGDGRGRVISPPDVEDEGAHILHVDMDAFYPSVATLDDPTLRGKPVVIGSLSGRGVVSSASYEARAYGVRSAMPVAQAMHLCPNAHIVAPNFDRYRELSAQVMEVFHSMTPLVEPLSIDEAFLDVAGAGRLWGRPREIARLLRSRVLEATGLTCSVGGAATKHVAKMASTLSKPDGVLIVAEKYTRAFLAPRPVGTLWGVGPKAAEALAGRGIHRVSDVLDTAPAVLDRVLGPAMAARILQLAQGIDDRAVETTRVEKSVSHEETFSVDLTNPVTIRMELRRLADRVGSRLRSHGWLTRTVSLKLRFDDFTTVSRSQSLPEGTDVSQRIGDVAVDLFASVDRRDPVRLVGVRAEKLSSAHTHSALLWDEDAEWRRVDSALDSAVSKFGAGALTRATFLDRAESIKDDGAGEK